jgi:allophanate hydrolase subunit 1
MRVLPAGPHALLVETDDPTGWAVALSARRDAGGLVATEIVPGARTVLLDGLPDPAAVAAALTGWSPAAPGRTAPADPTAVVTVPVRFDGADLADVAARWGTDPRGVADRLLATPLRVAFCGFAPGFAYLSGLPPEWAVPRLATPRSRVPAGAVGIAGPYLGIYPVASPGGWRIVGRTDLTLFDVDREPPALLTPGTAVRLTEARSDAEPGSGAGAGPGGEVAS